MKDIYSVAAEGVRLRSMHDTQCAMHDEAHAVTVCHNLRPDRLASGKATLHPVGTPVRISTTPMRPLTTMSADGRSYLVAAADNRLCIMETDQQPISMETGPTELSSLSLESEILCALADGERLTVMTATRAYRFRLSDGELREIDIAAMPSITLMAEDMTDLSAVVGERILSQAYPTGNHTLADRDQRAISDDIRTAYTDICRQAAASGRFIAPMVCRYRVISREGDTLLEGPPLLLGPSDSSRLTAPLALKSNDRRTVDAWQMSMPSWRPILTLNGEIPEELNDVVDRIEVVASAGLHPYDSSGNASATVVSGTASGDFIRVTAAGAWKSVSAGNSLSGQARLAKIACRRDCTTEVIATLRPSAGGELQIRVNPTGVEEQCRRIERLMEAQPEAAGTTLTRISPPHSFTACSGAALSGHELWGGLRAHRFGGYRAETFAASRAAVGAWHAAVSVNFGNGGERVVAVSEGLSGAPLTFGPLLSYPSPEATSITITVSAAGAVRTATFPLTPDPTNTHAIYIHPTLRAHNLSGTLPTFIIPAEKRIVMPMDSFVCACAVPSEAGPRRPLAVMPVSDGRVMSLWPCGRNSSGWESGSLRFIVMSDAGTHRATLSLLRRERPLTLTLIDSDTAPGEYAAAYAGGCLIAVLGRRLVKIGTGAVKTLADKVDARAIAYVAATGELWAETDGGVLVIDLESMTAYSRDESHLGASAGSYAELDGHIVDLVHETPRQQSYVRWSGSIATGDAYRRISGMALDVRSEYAANADLAVRRVNHDMTESYATCRLSASGRIATPLKTRCLSLPMRGCVFDFQARVSADTSISSFTITL